MLGGFHLTNILEGLHRSGKKYRSEVDIDVVGWIKHIHSIPRPEVLVETPQSAQNVAPTSTEMEQIRVGLKRAERRDWSLWFTSFFVILFLTAGVVAMSVPALMKAEEDFFYKFGLSQAVRGLVGVVLLFNVFSIYQLVINTNLRRRLEKQIETTTREQLKAEAFYKLAMVDPLTNLPNRRFAEERLASEVARSARHGYPLSVILLDLNDFKKINDRFGHGAGDQALQSFAHHLGMATRGSDLAARIGGDEFMVILPDCPAEEIGKVLGRLGPIEVTVAAETVLVSASVGATSYQSGESTSQMIARADQVLYANKRSKTSPRSEGRTTLL